MDCFFAAVEMRDNPELKNIPLAIGGKPETRGVISTANYVAREFGVRSAMSSAIAFQKCPTLTLLPGRMNYYREVSSQIRQIFQRYTDKIEPLSLDEAYLDVTGTTLFKGSATLIAEDIRKRIFEELNLTASAGVAPLKFLAKIASDQNKPNGIFIIRPEDVDEYIKNLPLAKIPGVGKVTANKLKSLELHYCRDVQKTNHLMLIENFGKLGQAIWDKSHGIDNREVNPNRIRKSIGVEYTLVKDIDSWSVYLNEFERLYQELERRLVAKQGNLIITRQGVKFKFNDFQQTTHEQRITELSKEKLLELAEETWQTKRIDRAVRTVGLSVSLPEPPQNKITQQLLLDI